MTIEEFKEKVKNLLNELGDEYTVFVYMETEDGDCYNFGYGCPGCATDHIAELKKNGSFAHHRVH